MTERHFYSWLSSEDSLSILHGLSEPLVSLNIIARISVFRWKVFKNKWYFDTKCTAILPVSENMNYVIPWLNHVCRGTDFGILQNFSLKCTFVFHGWSIVLVIRMKYKYLETTVRDVSGEKHTNSFTISRPVYNTKHNEVNNEEFIPGVRPLNIYSIHLHQSMKPTFHRWTTIKWWLWRISTQMEAVPLILHGVFTFQPKSICIYQTNKYLSITVKILYCFQLGKNRSHNVRST